MNFRQAALSLLLISCGGNGSAGSDAAGPAADAAFGLKDGACFVYGAGAITYYLAIQGPEAGAPPERHRFHVTLKSNGFDRRTEIWDSTGSSLLLIRRDDTLGGQIVSTTYDPGVPIALADANVATHVEMKANVTAASAARAVQFDLDVEKTADLTTAAGTVLAAKSVVTSDDGGSLAQETRWLSLGGGFFQMDLGAADLPLFSLSSMHVLKAGEHCAP